MQFQLDHISDVLDEIRRYLADLPSHTHQWIVIRKLDRYAGEHLGCVGFLMKCAECEEEKELWES